MTAMNRSGSRALPVFLASLAMGFGDAAGPSSARRGSTSTFRTSSRSSFRVLSVAGLLVFPLIFSTVIDRLPEDANPLSGLMVMAIVGGAVLPPVMGLVADGLHSVQLSFLVPLAALLYITWAAVAKRAGTTDSVSSS